MLKTSIVRWDIRGHRFGLFILNPKPPKTMATSTTIVRQLRLWSGLIAFAYVAMHLANHALGFISLEAMEAGRYGFLMIWRSGIGTALLYGAFSLHIGLALVSLYRRRHWRMPVWEFLQLLLGLLIPPFLISHAMGTRLAHRWFETTDSYTLVMLQYWRFNPEIGILITIFLVLAWLHGCIGLHFWLRLVPGYARVRLGLFAFALLLPVLALLGFTQAGREISRLAAQEGWVDQVRQQSNYPTPSQIDRHAGWLAGQRGHGVHRGYWDDLGTPGDSRGV